MGSADFVAFALTAGEVAATGEAAGAGDAALRENQGALAGVGDAATGDAAVAAAGSFFLECFALAGLGDASVVAAGVGLWAINVAVENAADAIMKTINLFMA
jgi:hypothetical protein